MKNSSPLVLASAAITISLILTGCDQEPTSSTEQYTVRPVNVMQLDARDQLQEQRFTGVVRSQDTTNLTFRVPGTIAELLVNEGDEVKKGQVLARLDPHDFQVDINRIQAQLNEAKAAYKLSKIEKKRTQQATTDNAIAHINLDRAISAESRAAANVELLQQSLIKAKDALRYTKLIAPFDGTIAKRFIDNYEQTSPNQKIITIHRPQQLEVVANVPERKLHLIKSGIPATVSWYGMNEEVSANVTKIASLPDPLTRTYDVTFALEPHVTTLFPGKAVNINLTTSLSREKRPTFCLPAIAINYSKQQPYIYLSSDKKAHAMPVKVIRGQQDKLCIQADLTLGDTVITSGSAYLKEGDSVKVLNEVRS